MALESRARSYRRTCSHEAFLIALLALSLVAAACSAGDPEPAPETTTATTAAAAELGPIVDVAAEAGSFGTLLAAAEAAGLAETLATGGPFTVLAPTDEAFAALPEGTLDALLADPEALADILLYHVIEGEVRAETVVTLDAATSLQGSGIAIAVVDGGVVLNECAIVVTTDVMASNGTIHVIDAVILPPSG